MPREASAELLTLDLPDLWTVILSAGQQNDEGCRLKGNTSIPAYDADWLVPQSSENWDSDSKGRNMCSYSFVKTSLLSAFLHSFPSSHLLPLHTDVVVIPQIREGLHSSSSSGTRTTLDQYVC